MIALCVCNRCICFFVCERESVSVFEQERAKSSCVCPTVSLSPVYPSCQASHTFFSEEDAVLFPDSPQKKEKLFFYLPLFPSAPIKEVVAVE